MAKSNNTNSLSISGDKLDEWLGSVGFLFPATELEKNRFDKLYDEYVFKLSDKKIDVESIMNDTYTCKSYCTRVIQIDSVEINELKMVARNGDAEVPDDILARMKAKHRKKDDNDKK